MNNQELAKIFYETAKYLEMQDVAFKPQAYEKAALTLETLPDDVKEVFQKGGQKALEELPGVGKSIAQKIVEYLKTKKVKEYEQLKKKMPVNIEELTRVEGIGPKMIRDLYKYLKIKNLNDLERAAKDGKIKSLSRFGLKTEQNILQGIEFLKRERGRFLLGEILPVVKEVSQKLKSQKEVQEVNSAGSVRRMKETIGDVDFLVISEKPAKVMDYFCSLRGIIKVLAKGKTRSSVKMEQGFDMDIRVISKESYGAALQYFTGSKEHNIVLRKIAIGRGLKLNEYGLFHGKKIVASKTEQEIYKALGLAWMEPEIRENQGEIEAALRQAQGKLSLPKLIGFNELLGDLHIHSNWAGGINSIEELAQFAMKMGYQYIGIADHTKFLKIEHGLNEKELAKRSVEIKKLNQKFKNQGSGFKILSGCEANILADGSLDIDNAALAKLDFVIAGVHSQLKMPKQEMTERIIKAMENPYVDIISHPTGRLIQKRDEYAIDFEKILKAAKRTNTVLEINSYPMRLDLKDIYIKKAKTTGVKMIINSDTHQKEQMPFVEYGISQARRGWAEKKDIINAWPLDKLLNLLKGRKELK
ncbi:MAG: DNA polymerase/3'-5' exonuclease PolX [Candidatus Pacebacteria bacterium]|nr:DNA polymerase/3'-5' exonuclease PolX [Candidatus Paceibacterota bacterium]